MNKKEFTFEIDENNCFNCTSHSTNSRTGHPMATINHKTQQVAKHIYEVCFCEIPEGKILRHKCDNPKCINPEHIEVGTVKDNQQDMKKRNRRFRAFGESNGNSILTTEKAIKIKKLINEGHRNKEIAEQFNISSRLISDIRHGNRWSHVELEVGK